MTILTTSLLTAFVVAFFASTAYLVLRDDLIGAAADRQDQMRHTYESRIAALRAEIDHAKSQQLLERQRMQRKMAELIERQERLTQRHSRLRPVLERAGELHADGTSIPVPTPRPDIRADLEPGNRTPNLPQLASALMPPADAIPWPLRASHQGADAARTNDLLLALDRSLEDLETDQVARVSSLSEAAYRSSEAISDALIAAGLAVSNEGYGGQDSGGPLLAAGYLPFDEKVRELAEGLDRLEQLKQTARRVPIANPVPGASVTSGFGVRRDPILGRRAHHSGIDFRAKSGTSVSAAGGGVVVYAGWNGGYGRMVEIDHGNNFTTRYAHLSKILVKKGDAVENGAVIGRVGSSGRSTGPHLHYEVRRNGKAVNPLPFISAGTQIAEYL